MMLQHEIKQHSVYTAKVSGEIVPLRVDLITKRPVYQYSRDPGKGKTINRVQYDCTNLVTQRKITVKSAQRFRHPASERIMTYLGLPTTWLSPFAQERIAREAEAHPLDDRNKPHLRMGPPTVVQL